MIQTMNIGLRFLLEIATLISIGYWGFKVGSGTFLKLLIGFGAPLFIAILWGLFASPKAQYKLHGIQHFAFEFGIFFVGVLALYASGKSKLAIILGVIIVINRILMFIWNQ